MPELNEQELDAYTTRTMKTAVYDEENGEVFATIPDLPGVWGAGEDKAAAEANLRAAVIGARYLEQG